MGNKKGMQIKEVRITNKIVEVICCDDSCMKVTRAQRNVLTNYKQTNYFDAIRKAFSNDHIVANDFKVIKDGDVVKHL